ncbi:MAG: GDSL-type esterase/lipase family protein [Polyangiaceae bacterium]
MAPKTRSRVARIARRIAKTLAILGAVLVLLAALAYKNVIPGGPELVDTAEVLRNVFRQRAFALEARSAPEGTVVFIGSSSVAAFPLTVYFPGKPVLNRGLTTETARELADRIAETLPSARPAGVVLWTGMNDLRSEAQPPAIVAERIARVLDAIEARHPGVPVAVIELPALCDLPPDSVARLRETNRLLAETAAAKRATLVSLSRPPITTAEGKLSVGLANPDRKHLSFAGYGVLARWLLAEGGPATAPLAPD